MAQLLVLAWLAGNNFKHKPTTHITMKLYYNAPDLMEAFSRARLILSFICTLSPYWEKRTYGKVSA